MEKIITEQSEIKETNQKSEVTEEYIDTEISYETIKKKKELDVKLSFEEIMIKAVEDLNKKLTDVKTEIITYVKTEITAVKTEITASLASIKETVDRNHKLLRELIEWQFEITTRHTLKRENDLGYYKPIEIKNFVKFEEYFWGRCFNINLDKNNFYLQNRLRGKKYYLFFLELANEKKIEIKLKPNDTLTEIMFKLFNFYKPYKETNEPFSREIEINISGEIRFDSNKSSIKIEIGEVKSYLDEYSDSKARKQCGNMLHFMYEILKKKFGSKITTDATIYYGRKESKYPVENIYDKDITFRYVWVTGC